MPGACFHAYLLRFDPDSGPAKFPDASAQPKASVKVERLKWRDSAVRLQVGVDLLRLVVAHGRFRFDSPGNLTPVHMPRMRSNTGAESISFAVAVSPLVMKCVSCP